MTMDVATCLDPQIAAALAVSPMGSIDFGTFTFESLPAMRQAHGRHARGRAAADHHRRRTRWSCPARPATTRRVRVYSPPTKATGRPCVYWIHGGGYLFGSGLTVDARLNRWVEEFDCVAVSIEYRLAPEDPYPAPLDDCYAGLLWTAQHADELGIDPARIAIAGASAGGGLAAGLAILARDRGEVDAGVPAPHLSDDRRPQHERVEPHRGRAGVEPRRQPPGLARLPRRAASARTYIPAYAAPARVESVGGPPTGVDRGRRARRLPRRGHRVRVAPAGRRASRPSCTCTRARAHGFEMIVPNSAIAQACQRDITEALRRALRPESVFASTS